MTEGVLRPVHGAGVVATVLIGVVALTEVLVAVLAWLTVDAVELTPLGAAVGRVLSWALLVGFVGAAIAFIVWMNRARHNSEAITSDQRHRFRNVWVFVGWFIPIENFCIPYAVMQDIWRGSDRSQPMLGLQHRDTSGLVLLWWLCFLLPNFSISLPPKYVFELTVFATISAALSVAAAVLAARMIRQLNAVQVSGPTASPAPAA